MLGYAVSDVGVVLNVRIDGHLSDPADIGDVLVDRAAVVAHESHPEVLASETMTGPRLEAASAAAGMTAASNSTVLQLSNSSQAESMDPRLFYACTPADPRVTQRVFHYLNILPFGLQRMADVFGVVGRHTNRGLVLGVTEGGQYRVMPYAQQQPLQLERVRTAPQLSFQRDTPLSAEVDPAFLTRVHRKSHSHQTHQQIAIFFRRAGARYGAVTRRSSLLTPDSTTASPFALSSTAAAAAPKLTASAALPNVGPALRAPRPAHRPTASRVAPAAAGTALGTSPMHGTMHSWKGSGSMLPKTGAGEMSANASARNSVVSVSRGRHPSLDESTLGGYLGNNASGTSGHGGRVEEVREELYALRDLQLPPSLALHGPVAPFRVGTRVVCRRFGCAGVLHIGVILSADFDVSYSVRYESDGEVDSGVLHSDIHGLGDVEDDGGPRQGKKPTQRELRGEPCRVRDHVLVEVAQRSHRAVVMAATGSGRYHLALLNAPVPLIEVEARQILSVRPILVGAVFAQPQHLALFRRLDATGSGRVSWKDVRHLVLSSEGFGQPLSFQRLGELQRDMRIRNRSVEPQLLSKVPVQEEEQQLTFRDFEYVLMRVENLL